MRCPQCHEQASNDASYCINCGAVLHLSSPARRPGRPVVSGTTAHLQPALPAGSPQFASLPGRAAVPASLVALVALCFATGEIIAIAQLITQHGWASWDLWPALLLTSGALLAESDWLNGALRRGLYGIVCWGALPWLLVTQQDIAWLMLPALGWWLIWYIKESS